MASLPDLPNEVLLIMLLCMQRYTLDRLQLVCRRFDRLVREFNRERRRPYQLARHSATLTILSATMIEMNLLEQGCAAYVTHEQLPRMLKRVDVKRVIMSALPAQGRWRECLRRLQRIRKYWSHAIAFIYYLPADNRMSKLITELFANASEIRFTHGTTWTNMAIFGPTNMYDIFLRRTTQLYVPQCGLFDCRFFNAFLEFTRPGGVRRIIVQHGNRVTLDVFHQLMRNFVNWTRTGPLDHAMAFIVVDAINHWGHFDPHRYRWGSLVVQQGGSVLFQHAELEAQVLVRLAVHQPSYILFLPTVLAGSYMDVPTRKQDWYRNIHRLFIPEGF